MAIPAGNLSRIAMRRRREMVGDLSLYGTPSSGQPRKMNFATESLKGAPEWKRSGIANANLLPGPRRRVHTPGGGPMNFDLTPGAQMDEIIEEGMANTFQAALGISAATISFDASDNSINGSGGTELANLLPGQHIRITGASTPSNNTDGASGRPWGCQVASKPSDGKAIIRHHTLTTEAAGSTIAIEGQACRNGTTLISVSYERDHTDMTTDRYWLYRAQVMNQIEYNFNFNEILTAVVNLTGMGPSDPTTVSQWNGETDLTESSQKTVVDASNNLKAFRAGGTLTGNLKSLTITHSHAVELNATGMELDPQGASLGTKGLTGNYTGYFVDGDNRTSKAKAGDVDDLHVYVVPDAAARGAGVPVYVFTVFRLKYTEMGDVTKSAITGAAMQQLAWEAEESEEFSDVWFQVCKLPSA